MFRNVGGANCLMRLLRTLRTGVELSGFRILSPMRLHDFLLRRVQTQRREVHRVRSHVGDMSRLIQMLRHNHRLAHREAQLPCRLLLQGARRKRRGWAFLHRLLLDVCDSELLVLAVSQKRLRLLLRLEAMRQRSLDGLSVHHKDRAHPIHRFTLETLNLLLTLHNQSHRHTLHTSSRQTWLQLFPQHG